MAQYRCSCKIGKRRAKGSNAISHYAYISASIEYDEERNKTWKYTGKNEVIYTETILPKHIEEIRPQYKDGNILWNDIQKLEKHSRAQLYREYEINLPIEIQDIIKAEPDLEKRKQLEQAGNAYYAELAKEYADVFTKQGQCCSVAVHNKDGNPHVHIMCTMRGFDKDKKEWLPKQKKIYLNKEGKEAKTKEERVYNKKNRTYKCKTVKTTDWDEKDKLFQIRKAVEIIENKKLKELGFDTR